MRGMEAQRKLTEAIVANRERLAAYQMYPSQISALHQIVGLAASHPDMQDCDPLVVRVCRDIREWCIVEMIKLGLTPAEAQLIDEMRGDNERLQA